MSIVTSLARAYSNAATTVGATSAAGWSHRPTRRPDRTAEHLARLDTRFQTSLHIQLETARRYDGRFTLTSTVLDGAEPGQDLALVATTCEQHIRVLDAVTLIDGALVLLWGNTEKEEAATALERLTAAGVLPPSTLKWTGAATFPADGLTAVSLTEAAAERVGTLATPDRPQRPTRLHAVATAPPAVRAEGSHTRGEGLAAVGG